MKWLKVKQKIAIILTDITGFKGHVLGYFNHPLQSLLVLGCARTKPVSDVSSMDCVSIAPLNKLNASVALCLLDVFAIVC